MPGPRLVSLDAFRGLAIAGMILVNNPGTWSAIYWPLAHAPWHGWTPTDLVFPFFLFAVGSAIPLSGRTTLRAALRRSAILFGLGLFMAAYPFFHLATLRIPGVLQRIAVCYLLAWILHRTLRPAGIAAVAVALLAGYWILLTRVPVPGTGAPSLEPATNLAAFVDRAVFTEAHLWKQSRTWDPEGLLSTLPALATTLLGVLAGRWITAEGPDARRKTVGLASAGAALALLGLAWDTVFPINKNLWTSSYAVFTAGLAALVLALLYFACDALGQRRWARPLVVYGVNAIVVFVASGLLAKTLYTVKVPGPEGPRSLHATLYQSLFAPLASPVVASLLFAIVNVVAWYAVLLWMDRRGWYVKV